MEENQAQQQQPTTQHPTEGGLDVPEAKKEKSSVGNWIILILASVVVVALVYFV